MLSNVVVVNKLILFNVIYVLKIPSLILILQGLCTTSNIKISTNNNYSSGTKKMIKVKIYNKLDSRDAFSC